MSKRIEVAPVALGAINGRAGVTSAVEGNLGATGIVAHPGGSISMRRLDDLLGVVVGGVKLLKIDVEGTEAQVLSGAMVTLTESHPLIIAEAATEDEVWAIDDILREYGYQREPANLAATPTYLWR
jgi:FkbM family methyltransferase